MQEKEFEQVAHRMYPYIYVLARKFSRYLPKYLFDDFVQSAYIGLWKVDFNKPDGFYKKVIRWAMNDFRKTEVRDQQRIETKLIEVLDKHRGLF